MTSPYKPLSPERMAEIRIEEAESISRPCPVCKAEPGQPCISTFDKSVRPWTHMERDT